MSRRIRVIPIYRRIVTLLIRRDVHNGQLRTLLQRVAPTTHPCDTKRTRGVVDSDERIPLPHDKRARRVYAKSHLLARRIERVTVAKRDDAQRVAHTRVWREKMPVRYWRVKICEFILQRELRFLFLSGSLERGCWEHLSKDVFDRLPRREHKGGPDRNTGTVPLALRHAFSRIELFLQHYKYRLYTTIVQSYHTLANWQNYRWKCLFHLGTFKFAAVDDKSTSSKLCG